MTESRSTEILRLMTECLKGLCIQYILYFSVWLSGQCHDALSDCAKPDFVDKRRLLDESQAIPVPGFRRFLRQSRHFSGKTPGAFWVRNGCWPRQDESEKTLSTLQSKNAELLGKVVRWWIWDLIYSSRLRILENLFENKGGTYPFWSDSWVGPVVSLTFKCGCVRKSWATSPCCICHLKFRCTEMLFLVLKPWKKLGPLVVSSFLAVVPIYCTRLGLGMETRQIRLLQPLPVRLERVLLMQARTRSCQATCQKPERAVVEVGCSGGYGGQGS